MLRRRGPMAWAEGGAMRMSVYAAVLTGLAWLNGQQPVTSPDHEAAIRLFHQRVDAYAALHRRLEAPLLTLTQARDMRRNFVARHLLATAIRRSRVEAQQ